MIQITNSRKIIFITLTAILAVFSSAKAVEVITQPDGSYLYNLKAGELFSGYNINSRDNIACERSYNPPTPPPPPPPVCPTADYRSAESNLRSNISRLSNGKCGSWYVRHCGDWLEDHALEDTKRILESRITDLRHLAEKVCQMSDQSCSRSDVANVARDYESTIHQLEQSKIKIRQGDNSFVEIPMLDPNINVRLFCPGRPRF